MENDFKKQLDELLRGEYKGETLTVLEKTPKLLQSVGVPDLPVVISRGTLDKVMNESGNREAHYHDLGNLTLKLPEIIESPAMICNSLLHPQNSIVIISTEKDRLGRPIIVALRVNKNIRANRPYLFVNSIASAYGREEFTLFLNDNIAAQTIFFIDTKKEPAHFEFRAIIAQHSFANSNIIIRQYNEDVKRLEENISKMKKAPRNSPIYEQMYREGLDVIRKKIREEKAMKYIVTTKQGYEVEGLYYDGSRSYAIAVRPQGDFIIAAGYNTNTGEWAQGYYYYKDYIAAEKALREMRPEAEQFIFPEAHGAETPGDSFLLMSRITLPKETGDDEHNGPEQEIYYGKLENYNPTTKVYDVSDDSLIFIKSRKIEPTEELEAYTVTKDELAFAKDRLLEHEFTAKTMKALHELGWLPFYNAAQLAGTFSYDELETELDMRDDTAIPGEGNPALSRVSTVRIAQAVVHYEAVRGQCAEELVNAYREYRVMDFLLRSGWLDNEDEFYRVTGLRLAGSVGVDIDIKTVKELIEKYQGEFFDDGVTGRVGNFEALKKYAPLAERKLSDLYNASNRATLAHFWRKDYVAEAKEAEEREIAEARERAHAAGLPFSDLPYEGEEDDFNPLVYDGSMSVEDYKQMWRDIENSEAKKMKELVQAVVKEGTEKTESLSWVSYFEEFGVDKEFVKAHKEEIGQYFSEREEVAEIEVTDEAFDLVFWGDYCANKNEIFAEEEGQTMIEQSEQLSYAELVRQSVEAEYRAFFEEELKKPPEVLISQDNYKIRFYNELSTFLEDAANENLTDRDLEALYADAPNILSLLYDDFLDNEFYSINTYADTAEMIASYNDKHHAAIVADRYGNVSLPTERAPRELTEEEREKLYFRRDTVEDIRCSRALSKALEESADGNLTREVFSNVVKEFGFERILHVTAGTIESKSWDPRFPNPLKEWADENVGDVGFPAVYGISTHPSVIARFANQLRSIQAEYQALTLLADAGFDRFYAMQKEVPSSTLKAVLERALTQREKGLPVENYYKLSLASPESIRHVIKNYAAYHNRFAERIEAFGRKREALNLIVNAPEEKLLLSKIAERSDFFGVEDIGEYAVIGGGNIHMTEFHDPQSMDDGEILGIDKIRDYYAMIDKRAKELQAWAVERIANREITELDFNQVPTEEKDSSSEVNTVAEQDPTSTPKAENSKTDDKGVYTIELPVSTRRKQLAKATVFEMPQGSGWEGNTYVLPNSLLAEDGETITVTLPKSFSVSVKSAEGKTENLSAKYFTESLEKAAAQPRAEEPTEKKYIYISLPLQARLGTFDTKDGKKTTLFKMPNGGEYEGKAFYFPNGLLKENADGKTIRLSIPDDYKFLLQQMGEKSEIDRETFLNAVKGVKEADFRQKFVRPSEAAFEALKGRLIANVPEEMKARPNWVAMSTFKQEGKEHLGKKLIDCHTGQWAKSSDPSTWATFEEALKYAEEHGADSIAYALDGKDKIACIDVDSCMDEESKYSKTAEEVLARANGTYCERSISGKGLHFFAKTAGFDIRSFSRDGTLEFYQDAHFISMTGDVVGESKELKSFDAPAMKLYLQEKCDKRVEWKGQGQGLTGLSTLSDQQVLDKAFKSKNGDRIKALYNGENLLNNRSNSDMALMSHLAYWCNGDKEQMLRIFATSGLHRPEKSPSYYEITAQKAAQSASGYQGSSGNPAGSAKTSAPKTSGNVNSK